jgi:periplasmic protein CpxP/Spy
MNARNLLGIYVICLLLTGSAAAVAQGGRPGGPRFGGMNQGAPPALPDSTGIVKIVDEMSQALSLSPDQKKQVSDLHFTHFSEACSQRGNTGGDRQAQREKMDALRTRFESKIKALLNDEQQTKFEKLAKNRGPLRGR